MQRAARGPGDELMLCDDGGLPSRGRGSANSGKGGGPEWGYDGAHSGGFSEGPENNRVHDWGFLDLGGAMSKRPVCRHFLKIGGRRLEDSCAFYHPAGGGDAQADDGADGDPRLREVRRLAAILVDEWMGIIPSQSNVQPAEKDNKWREEGKGRSPVHEKAPPAKTEVKDEYMPEKWKEKPKTVRTTVPSHAKFRSTGLEMETPVPGPANKNINAVVISDKYSIKVTPPLKRQSSVTGATNPPPAEKKYKPFNTTPSVAKEIKVKIIPAQPMESVCFLDALNSAPIVGVKIKKKKPLSPTSKKSGPFEGKTMPEASDAKPPSPDPVAEAEPMGVARPTTPLPAEEVPEPMEMEPAAPMEAKPVEALKEVLPMPPSLLPLTKKGRKKKMVSWCEESKLREYFYFEMDETEHVNVNKIKDFGEAAKREMMMDRQVFETAWRLSHRAVEEMVPWFHPKHIDMIPTLATWGSCSVEKFTQAGREKLILQEIFLTKESIPDSPHEPDPESYEPLPPKLIPLDVESSLDVTVFQDALEQGAASQFPASAAGAKLPPVLAIPVGRMGTVKGQQAPNPVAAILVQEILISIMGTQGNMKPEELMKQPDFSDKIKQLLENLQGAPPAPPGGGLGLLRPPLLVNSFPAAPKNLLHFPPAGPFPPFQGPGGPGGPIILGGPGGLIVPGGPGGPPGPWMMRPPPPMPPPPQHNGFWEHPNENMRGGPHGGMRGGPPFVRGRGQDGELNFRGQGGPPMAGRGGGHEDMSKRSLCRHFMKRGTCRYEDKCAFYHPGVNGPPLP